MHPKKKSLFPLYVHAQQMHLLLFGEGDLLKKRLSSYLEFDFASISIFVSNSDSTIDDFQNTSLVTICKGFPKATDFEKNDIAIYVAQTETDWKPFHEQAQKFCRYVHHDSLDAFFEQISKQEKEIIQKAKSEIPKTKVYQTPYEILDYFTHYAKAAKLKANIFLAIIGLLLLIGFLFISLYELHWYPEAKAFLEQDRYLFLWMILVGFVAEMVAGSMGMGYGVICTTILLLLNVPPPIVSASIHSAETFTSAAGTYSHYKLKNINFKLVKHLAPYAIIGAIFGSVVLTYFGENYAQIVKPIIAGYTFFLGVNIFIKTLSSKQKSRLKRTTTNLPVIGTLGGFIDGFAGGGWGPLVTGSLIKDGRTARYVVGSSTFAKFLLTITSAITFLLTLGGHHWNIILGLLLGGVITAPFSAMLTSRMPVKKMTIAISILVMIMSSITIYKSIF